MDIENIIAEFIKVCELAKINLTKEDVEVHMLPAGDKHIPTRLKLGHMAVYIFTNMTGDICYKVGKVGANSNARYQTQHYSPNSSRSNLANSILNDYSINANEEIQSNITRWIKHNTTRTNLVLNADKGIMTLNLLEAFIQCRLNPKYEGFDSQRD